MALRRDAAKAGDHDCTRAVCWNGAAVAHAIERALDRRPDSLCGSRDDQRVFKKRAGGPFRNSSVKRSELTRHFDHRAAETRLLEEALRGMVALGSPQHDTRRALRLQPQARGFDQRARHAAAAVRLVHDEVVNEARGVAQLLPRQRLEPGVHVGHHFASAIRHEHGGVDVAQLAAEEAAVALFRVAARCEKTLRIEPVVEAHQRRAQAAKSRHVVLGGLADADIGRERRHQGTDTWSSAPYSIVRSLSRAAHASSVVTSRATVPSKARRPFTVTCTGSSKSITSGDRSSVNAWTPRVRTSKPLPRRVASTRPDGVSRSKSGTRTAPFGENSLTSGSATSL